MKCGAFRLWCFTVQHILPSFKHGAPPQTYISIYVHIFFHCNLCIHLMTDKFHKFAATKAATRNMGLISRFHGMSLCFVLQPKTHTQTFLRPLSNMCVAYVTRPRMCQHILCSCPEPQPSLNHPIFRLIHHETL